MSYLDPKSVNGLNLYCYCLNNPISYCDPSGHWVKTIFDLLSVATSVVEVVINPLDPWAWAGLVGDALDLIPFVTGVGESIKGVRVVAKGLDLVDDTLDTVRFVKAADMIDDFSDGGTMLRRVGNLDDYRALTKTNHVDGTNLHTLFMKNEKTIKNTRKRVDGINTLTKTIYELKAFNKRGIKKSVKQILNYNDLLGGGFKMIIVVY